MNALTREIETCLSQLDVRGDGELSARFVFPPRFAGFSGHFPGNPVLPGVCMVQAALVMLQAATRRPVSLQRLVSAKWYAPVKPGDEIRFDGRTSPEDDLTLLLKARIACGADKVADLALKVTLRDVVKDPAA